MTQNMREVGSFHLWEKDGLEHLPAEIQELIKDCQIHGRGLGTEHPEEAWFYHLEGKTLHRIGEVTAGADVISRKFPLVENGLYLGRCALRIKTAHGVMMGLVDGRLVLPTSFEGYDGCDWAAGDHYALRRLLSEHVRIVRRGDILFPPNIVGWMMKLEPFKEKRLAQAGSEFCAPHRSFLSDQDQCAYRLIDWDLSQEGDDFTATYLALESRYYIRQDKVSCSALRPMVTVDNGVITGFFGPHGFVELKKYETDPLAAIAF